MQPTLTFDVKSPIGVITLNQPEKRNAINAAMWGGLREAVKNAEADPAVKVIIIRGAGDHFAAGADISEFAGVYATVDTAEAYTRTMLDALAALEACPKPSIAAIRGACFGGGCSIALSCDFRTASTSAKFSIPPGKLGLVYSLADTRRLSQAVGVSAAKDLLLTARIIDGLEAGEINLCDHVVEDTMLDDTVLTITNSIASLSQWSVQATKKMFAFLARGDNDMSDDALALMLEAFNKPDFKEGYKAFLEKRKPNFPLS